jgi:hypothetical protein
MSELDLSKGSVDINVNELGMDTDEAGKALGEQGGQKVADEAINNPQAGHEGIEGGGIDPATVDSIEPVLNDDDNHSRSEHECKSTPIVRLVSAPPPQWLTGSRVVKLSLRDFVNSFDHIFTG